MTNLKPFLHLMSLTGVAALASTLFAFHSDSASLQETTAEIAASATQGVGNVQSAWSAGTKGTVFVIEEFHTSRVGRLQTGIMLLRLHDRYQTRRIGLEGAMQSAKPIDATWFHNAGGTQARIAREDVAVRMLAE